MTAVSAGPVEDTTSPLTAVDHVDDATIAEALALQVKIGGAKDKTPITRVDIPDLTLAICLENKGRDPIASIKNIAKINKRCDKQLSPNEISTIVAATNLLISNYLEAKDDADRAAVKKKRDSEKAADKKKRDLEKAAKQQESEREKAPVAISTVGPAKGDPMPVTAIDKVDGTTIADALAKVNSAKSGATVARIDLPKIILGCCLGDDDKPRDTVSSIKAIGKINERCTERLTSGEIASLVDETNEAIYTYIDIRDDAEKQRAFDKKRRDLQKLQDQRDAERLSEDTLVVDDDTAQEADKIYHSGYFMEYVTKQFLATWNGDTHILSFVMAMFANGFISNTDEGLHLHLSGDSGLGKSESAKHALTFIPKKYRVVAQFSKKAPLYHSQKYPPGTIVLNDDKTYSEEEIGLIRAMLAGWSEPTPYCTMDGTNPITVTIPERISQIIPSVDGIAQVESSGQNESRFVVIRISRTLADMRAITDLIKKPGTVDQHAVSVIMAIWHEYITKQRTEIAIPYIERIMIQDDALWKIREFKKFVTLIKALTLLNGRTTATEKEFEQAQQMWNYLSLMESNEITGLSKTEKIVFNHLVVGRNILSELKKKCGLPDESFYRAWRGIDGNFTRINGGLLSKIPELHMEAFHDKDTGLSDRIVTFEGGHKFRVEAPYTLKPEGS